MSIVRFAHICDKCGERQPEYEPISSCVCCMYNTCLKCDVSSERDEESNRTLCTGCAALEYTESGNQTDFHFTYTKYLFYSWTPAVSIDGWQ